MKWPIILTRDIKMYLSNPHLITIDMPVRNVTGITISFGSIRYYNVKQQLYYYRYGGPVKTMYSFKILNHKSLNKQIKK